MIKRLVHNYMIDTNKRLLYKLEKEKNMLWSKGGYPALRKDVVMDNLHRIDWIGVKTEKRRFIINKKDIGKFEDIKFGGYEPQIYLDQSFFEESGWKITKLNGKDNKK